MLFGAVASEMFARQPANPRERVLPLLISQLQALGYTDLHDPGAPRRVADAVAERVNGSTRRAADTAGGVRAREKTRSSRCATSFRTRRCKASMHS